MTTPPHRILSVTPRSRSFGYAVIETPHRLVDWGTRATRSQKAPRTWKGIALLVSVFEPDLVVLEDAQDHASRRSKRIRQLLTGLMTKASRRGINVAAVPAAAVRSVFRELHAFNKDEIARVLVAQFPELTPRLPPRRKPWMSEDERMSIFDAIALAITHIKSNK